MAKWANIEIATLEEFYGEFPNKEVAELLGKSKQAIQHKAHRLGITTKIVATRKYCVDCGTMLSRPAIYRDAVKRCVPCGGVYHSGDNHHNWKGGVSQLKSLVHCLLNPVWTVPIMRRDDHTCLVCEKRGGDLAVHHVRPYIEIRDHVIAANSEISMLSFSGRKKMALLIVAEHDLDDGITLCVKCHKLVHNDSRGELLGSLNGNAEGNQQPSPPKLKLIVSGTVHRLTGEDTATDKPDTSAPQADSLLAGRYSRNLRETVRSEA